MINLHRQNDEVIVLGGFQTVEAACSAKSSWEARMNQPLILRDSLTRGEITMSKKDAKDPKAEAAAPATKPPKASKEPAEPKKERGPSYQDKIKKFLDDNNGIAAKEDLMEATESDAKNLSVSVSILRNSTRTKEPRKVVYLRGNETYYDLDNPRGAKAYTSDTEALKKQAELDKKEARKEKKAEAAVDPKSAKK